MTAINFNKAFEVLQLHPGVSFIEIKQRYEALVSLTPSTTESGLARKTNFSLEEIAAAYNDLQLLTKPYEALAQTEQTSLLHAFNEMSDEELDFWLNFYPHRSNKFYWDSRNYPQVAMYLTKSFYKTTTQILSSAGTFFSAFTSCYSTPGNEEETYKDAVELPLWTKKNQ
ncbi:hypothetical protein [Legionella clemsonensis]|uniref:Uncharacterized protein n=1 Tax=Legionella clemsonensis TaxID=1867846 RepID=A0A222P653_9GAMM|nr:hypothetical protein [Legionella clemsonensis]ASQ47255.1 hypothetical protein clem_13640 [Legionella clemsonensis]